MRGKQMFLTLSEEIINKINSVLCHSFSTTVAKILERAAAEKWAINYNRPMVSKVATVVIKAVQFAPELLDFMPSVGSRSFRIYCVLAYYCENMDTLGLPMPTDPA